jgi:hypothetical protein
LVNPQNGITNGEEEMIRNFKIVGLALIPVLALTALTSAASAQAANGRLTSTGNVTLTGTEITPGKATAFGLTVECPGSTAVGHKVGSTTAFLPNGSEEVTITPTFKQPCKSNVGPSTIDMNGCDVVSHIGETTGVADTYSGTSDLVCPAGKDVTVTSWFSEAEHKEGKEACTIHVSPQTGVKGGTVKDTTEGDLVLNGPVRGKAVETKDGLHSLLCPAKEGEGELSGVATVKGHNEVGANTAISLSHL